MFRNLLIGFCVLLLQGCLCPTCFYQVHTVESMWMVDSLQRKDKIKIVTTYSSYNVYGNVYRYISSGERVEILFKDRIAKYLIMPQGKRFTIIEN